ncbi:MAG: YceI family protein, partial [Nocardioides sp.]|nr:YceI family protein [Nocardioides sp.]
MSIFSRTTKPATLDHSFDAPTSAVEDITGDYTLDTTHTRLGFSARHAMVTTVRGSFKEFEGTAHVDTANPSASTIALTIKTASIDTGVADRDAHLRSADFFNADENKEITFSSTKVERDGDDWAVTGDLSIKGETKPVTIDFEFTGSARDPSATCGWASRAAPASPARTGASPGTPRSRPAACSSPT